MPRTGSQTVTVEGGGVSSAVTVNTLPAGTVAGSSSLPAGTNNIGDVDVLSLPALPAGSNNIGDVDVLSLPALPTGNNNIGDVDVLTLPALPAGTNAIGKLAANSGVDIGDVDIASWTGAPNVMMARATAGSASGVIIASRSTRRSMLLRNTHATDGVYLGTGTVSASNGFLLPADATLTLMTTAGVNGIRAGSNDVVVHIVEEYN